MHESRLPLPLPRRSLAAWCLLAVVAAPLAAQSPAPFSTVEVSARATTTLNRDPLRDYWRPESGLELRAATPFYLGSGGVVIHLMPFTPATDDLVDMDVLSVLIEWGVEPGISERLQGAAGIRFGKTTFKFWTREDRVSALEESELQTGAYAGLTGRLGRGWSVSLSASHQRIFTAIPIRFSLGSAGLAYAFTTPAWLRTVLE